LPQEGNKILRYADTAELGDVVILIAIKRQTILNQTAVPIVAEHIVLIEEENFWIGSMNAIHQGLEARVKIFAQTQGYRAVSLRREKRAPKTFAHIEVHQQVRVKDKDLNAMRFEKVDSFLQTMDIGCIRGINCTIAANQAVEYGIADGRILDDDFVNELFLQGRSVAIAGVILRQAAFIGNSVARVSITDG
jgi:hypothetical protein